MGEAWYFRHAFEQASKYKASQDDWCNAADQIGAVNMKTYLPQELEWESLSAVLRGQVMVNTHCYTVSTLTSLEMQTDMEIGAGSRIFHWLHERIQVPSEGFSSRAPDLSDSRSAEKGLRRPRTCRCTFRRQYELQGTCHCAV